jgi:pseudaminic acid cytidylyltransferase
MNIAIIPARGGSKRIPRKNIKKFLGKPILTYSIEAARESGLFEKIIVTTDDEEIAEIAIDCGADVPFLRPESLSNDFSTTVEAVEHAIKWLKTSGEQYEFVCTIYATAPFIRSEYLVEGYKILKESSAVHSFSATTSPFPIQRMFKMDKKGRAEMFFPNHLETRSQDLEQAYHDAGQFYWSRSQGHATESMFGKHSIPVILPRFLVQDIDTKEDWIRAEVMYKVLLETGVLK